MAPPRPLSVKIRPSRRAGKKMVAVFALDNGRTRTVHFGAEGMSDYTLHRDAARKRRYLARHAAREDWGAPLTAGALSRWVLWNKPTRRASIADFKRRFRLSRPRA